MRNYGQTYYKHKIPFSVLIVEVYNNDIQSVLLPAVVENRTICLFLFERSARGLSPLSSICWCKTNDVRDMHMNKARSLPGL